MAGTVPRAGKRVPKSRKSLCLQLASGWKIHSMYKYMYNMSGMKL